VPQLAVLAHASAVITHGGMNTVNEALWFGVPMLVYPQRGDQHLVASRVEELGAGLRATEITPLTLRRSVARLLDEPGFRASASRLGRTLHEAGGAVRAADVILSFVSSREVTA
jgi:MGT family glycosyltransferase